MKNGRPRTGKKGRPVNIYLPTELIEAAKRRFYVEKGMSLSEGIKVLLSKELESERGKAS